MSWIEEKEKLFVSTRLYAASVWGFSDERAPFQTPPTEIRPSRLGPCDQKKRLLNPCTEPSLLTASVVASAKTPDPRRARHLFVGNKLLYFALRLFAQHQGANVRSWHWWRRTLWEEVVLDLASTCVSFVWEKEKLTSPSLLSWEMERQRIPDVHVSL